MRIYPALKKIPEYVLAEGKKNLSEEVVLELTKIISDLKRVSPEEKASAYCRIGIMNSYLNNFEQAKDDYYYSYSLDGDDIVFANYLIMLQRLNQISKAFDEACDYLDRNPNNSVVFDALIQITMKTPLKSRIDKLNSYRPYQTESVDITQSRNELIKSIIDDSFIFSKYDLDIDFYESYLSIALNTVHKLSKNDVQIGLIENQELSLFTICIRSNFWDFSDIVTLNKMFDAQIFNYVESGVLDKSLYFDHLSKLSLIYSVERSMREDAA